MSKILLLADIHAHMYREFSKPHPVYGNSRLARIIQYLDFMRAYCTKNEIYDVVILGDLFHVRSHIVVPVFTSVFASLFEYSKRNIRIHLLQGNHDQYSRNGKVHSLQPFSSFCKVTEQPVSYDIAGYKVGMIPHTTDIDLFWSSIDEFSDCDVVFGHQSLDEAVVSTGHALSDSVGSYKRLSSDVSYYFGHIHDHQTIRHNFMYVGSPMQHSFSEADTRKYLGVVFNGESYTLVKNTVCPVFHVVEADEIGKHPTTDFFRVMVDEASDIAEVRKFCKKHKYDHVRIDVKKKKDIEVSRAVKSGATHEEMIEEYTKGTNKGSEFSKYGLSLLKKVAK